MEVLSAAFVMFMGTSGCLYNVPKPVKSEIEEPRGGDVLVSSGSGISFSSNTMVYPMQDYDDGPGGCRVLFFRSRAELDDYIDRYKITSARVFSTVGDMVQIEVTQHEKPKYNGRVEE